LLAKVVKSHQVNLILAGFIHLKPQCCAALATPPVAATASRPAGRSRAVANQKLNNTKATNDIPTLLVKPVLVGTYYNELVINIQGKGREEKSSNISTFNFSFNFMYLGHLILLFNETLVGIQWNFNDWDS
jgi:hypothetical protein